MPTLPAALDQLVQEINAHDPSLGDRAEDTLQRLLSAAQAMAWARDQAPRLARAGAPAAVLEEVVAIARELTSAPEAWALKWTEARGRVRVRALAGGGPRVDGQLLRPEALSRSLVGQVAESGRPAWSDDAASDSRFADAASVAAMSLRSVGCLPLGPHGVLYLADPTTPGRFSATQRARLSALCTLAAAFLGEAPSPEPVQSLPGMVGSSVAMGHLARTVRAFAPVPWPLLVLGETGTGKELVARAVHELGPTSNGPFIAANAGAIPEQLAESTLFGHVRGAFTGADRDTEGWVGRAQGGTLFLDEVGELSHANQVRLLRLLQEGTYQRVGEPRERRFDGRIVAATHRAIDQADQAFREDLYHRLSTCVIEVPPLRARRDDVPELARHVLRAATEELGIDALELSDAALRELAGRGWAGNVRELVNTMRGAAARAMSSGDSVVGPEHLSAERKSSVTAAAADTSADITNLAAATEAFQQGRVRAALQVEAGNKSAAALRLGVSRQWLHRLVARWEKQGFSW